MAVAWHGQLRLLTKQDGECVMHPCVLNKPLIIGRVAASDITLDLPTISSAHCSIEYDEQAGRSKIHDNSTNGTFVNGTLVGKGKGVFLQDSDVITFSIQNHLPQATFTTCEVSDLAKNSKRKRETFDTVDVAGVVKSGSSAAAEVLKERTRYKVRRVGARIARRTLVISGCM